MAMNPERIRMLEQTADQPLEPLPPPPDIKSIRITGANLLAFQEDDKNWNRPRRHTSIEAEAVVPPRKRSYDTFIEKMAKHRRLDKQPRRGGKPPKFPSPPPANHHTAHLANLLRTRPLHLILEPTATKKGAPSAVTYKHHVTNAGLVLTESIWKLSNLSVLRLPTLAEAESGFPPLQRPLTRVARGELLEDV
ncbi:hypothetical protein QQS21_002316 [Conoideocrella luteorostrata]|uniref:Uncharacterized protein n=1 Tax=Conoideocrella luteorostrata TaxID=1105319 RepID=A0AAJ0CVA6_9HYPO|nr:hypothetical protein QQS21_002316 [Conoideocrella luteorostrata]